MSKIYYMKSYFQSKWLLNGLSMSGNDYTEYHNSIKTLKDALALPQSQCPAYLSVRNSSIETFWDVSTDSEISNFDSKAYYYFRMMGVN
jgi:hypothetical protein